MERLAFTARCGFAKEEEEAFIVGFADSEKEPGNYIIVQRVVEQDAEEVNGELNSYFLELNDRSMSGYGGIRHVLLSRERLVLALAPANQYCGEIKEIDVVLAEGCIDFEEVVTYLGRIFDDTDCHFTVG
ncbi:Imm10 family immunity protein [Massilia sp. METH4]|uniref:Imm10 family immunity protein n=1 Tax=Massilia sp. METH4 TaxID=3123041 RepID=UPI0030D390E5